MAWPMEGSSQTTYVILPKPGKGGLERGRGGDGEQLLGKIKVILRAGEAQGHTDNTCSQLHCTARC